MTAPRQAPLVLVLLAAAACVALARAPAAPERAPQGPRKTASAPPALALGARRVLSPGVVPGARASRPPPDDAPLRPPPTLAPRLRPADGRGFLEGVLVGHDSEREGGLARLWSGPWDLASGALPAPAQALAIAVLDGRGRFVFGDLEAGPYVVAVEDRDGCVRHRAVRVAGRGMATPRVLFHLGQAAVEGRVHDGAGRPVGSARVRAIPRRGEGGVMEVETGPEGTYRLEGLQPVRHRFMVCEPGAGATRSIGRQLRAGETLHLDFGDPRGAPCVSGRVCDASGAALARAGVLHLTCLEGEAAQAVPWGQDGRFRAHLAPGRYRVHLELWGSPRRLVQAPAVLEVGTEGLGHDPVLPGASVRGTVYGHGGGSEAPSRLGLVRLAAGQDGDPVDVSCVGEDGSFAFVGVMPGRYAIVGRPGALVDETGRPASVVVPRAGSPPWLRLEPARR